MILSLFFVRLVLYSMNVGLNFTLFVHGVSPSNLGHSKRRVGVRF